MSLFSNNKKDEVKLLIDIGSYSIAGAVVIFSKNKIPQIIFNKRISLPLNEEWGREKMIATISSNLEHLLKMVIEESTKRISVGTKKLKNKKIDEVLCVMSSPWCLSKVKTVTLKKEKPVNISSKIMESVAREAGKGTSDTEDYELIEKKIIQTKINGYITKSPLNKKASEIEISSFEGRVLKEIMGKVTEVLYKLVSKDVIFHSSTLSAFTAIEEIFNEKDYLITEITGEMTEISVIKNGLITKTASFPKGKNLFLRNVSREFDVDTDISLSFIKLYYEQKSEKKFHSRIKEVVRQAELEWFGTFKEILETIKEPIPSKIFLIMDSVLAPFFLEFLKSEIIEIGKKSDIVSLNTSALNHFCNFSDNNPDPFLALEAIFLNKTIN